MPFSKRKPRRNPLQRLNDQRRSLALAGLALGAVFGGAIFRRKRRGQEVRPEPTVRFEENVPVVAPEAAVPVMTPEAAASVVAPAPVAPAAPVESVPPSIAEVPPATSEPELEDAPQPINAAPASEGAAGAEAEPAAAAPVEPATGELSAGEASILAVLAQSGRADDDRTALAVATSLEREADDVVDVLRKLGAEGVVSGELQTPSGEEVWAVTERGVRRLGAQS